MSKVASKAARRDSENSRWSFLRRCGPNDNFDGAARERFIDVSSDGESLVFSKFGAENFEETNLVDEVFKSLKVLGDYSEDSEGNFVNDRSYLRFLLVKYLPDSFKKQKLVDIDLNDPDGKVEYYSDNGLDLNNLLAWIVNNIDIFKKEMGLCVNITRGEGGKFVFLKKVVSKFFQIPHFNCHQCKFYATCVNGMIYLMRDYKTTKKQKPTSVIWVNKFRQYMTKDDTSKKIVCDENFRAVLSCSLGPHKLIYSASVDCANPEEFDDDFTDLSGFLHLKCWEENTSYSGFKSAHWYMDHIISGISKVLVGSRDRKGIVSKLRLYEPRELLNMHRKEKWNPANCLIFTSKLLSFIKSRVESDPGAVFCLKCFEKGSNMTMVSCTKEPEVENFLPVWFQNEMLEVVDAK